MMIPHSERLRRSRPWFKVWARHTIYGTTFTELAAVPRAVWFSLLCFACDSQEPGVVGEGTPIQIGYTPAQLAVKMKLSEQEVSESLDILGRCGKIAIDADGVIRITKWNTYQSDYDRTRKAASRTRKRTPKRTVKSTPHVTPPDVTEDTEDTECTEGNRRKTAPPAHLERLSQTPDHKLKADAAGMEASFLVEQFKKKANWIGDDRPVWRTIRDLLGAGFKREAIEKATETSIKPGHKHFDLANILQPRPSDAETTSQPTDDNVRKVHL
jgi:hypothetical protein